MPNVPVACSFARCPGFAVPDGRGKCGRHKQTTDQRGYGRTHQDARASLQVTLPAPCGYCGQMLRQGDAWVAAHRIDGDPSAGWMVSHPACNERAKHSLMQVYRIGGVAGSKLAEMRTLDDPRGVSHTFNEAGKR